MQRTREIGGGLELPCSSVKIQEVNVGPANGEDKPVMKECSHGLKQAL